MIPKPVESYKGLCTVNSISTSYRVADRAYRKGEKRERYTFFRKTAPCLSGIAGISLSLENNSTEVSKVL